MKKHEITFMIPMKEAVQAENHKQAIRIIRNKYKEVDGNLVIILSSEEIKDE